MIRFSQIKHICATTSLLGILLMIAYMKEPEVAFDREFLNNYTPENGDFNEADDDSSFSQKKPLPPKCEQNMKAANISKFLSLSSQIQDFLYYNHCRSFPMLLDLPAKCGQPGKPEDIFLLLVIKTHPMNYENREVLRKTWAKERFHKGKSIRTIFISGTEGSGFEKERMNKLLALENLQHKDILQWDFSDTFFNLTLKQMLFLEWFDRHCSHARFLLNGDDDVLALTDNMVEYLQSLEDNDGSKHLFTGHMIQKAYPIRRPNSKYFIPIQLHNEDAYPPYCGGGGYLLSGYTALVIYNMSKSIPLFPIDDVYMGMCLKEAKLAPDAHKGVKTLGWYIPSKQIDRFDPCFMKELLLIHKFPPADIYIMWHEVHNPRLKCGVEK